MAVNERRDRHDIIADILKTARVRTRKTHIMYKARLSFSQTDKFLDLLVEKRFLENMEVKRKRQILKMYRITKKGMELLHHLESINKLFDISMNRSYAFVP